MKRLLSILIIAVCSSLLAGANEGGYMTHKVSITIDAHENSVWDVTEVLDVEFTEPRHGIYRYVPSKFIYSFPRGNGKWDDEWYLNEINNVDVKDRYYRWYEEHSSEAVNTIIQIGSPDKLVEGHQQYVIKYSIRFRDDRHSSEDFLCHSVWGAGAPTQIDTLDFVFNFEKAMPADFTFEVNSGAHGSKGNNDNVECKWDAATNKLTGHVVNLPANHAITVSAQLPDGYWNPFVKNRALLYVFAVITVIFAVLMLYRAWRNYTRKPIPVVSFYPPEGMTSAEVGKIVDNITDNSDLASLVPWLANRGHIAIEQIPGEDGKKDLKLVRKIPLPPKSPGYLKAFMKALFGKEKEVVLSEMGNRYSAMSVVIDAIDKKYTGKKKLIVYDRGFLYWIGMVLGAIGCFWASHETKIVSQFPLLASILFVIAPMGLILFIRIAYAFVRYVYTLKYKAIELAVCIAIGALGLYLLDLFVWQEEICMPKWVFMSGSAALMIVTLSAKMLIADSDHRIKVMGEIFGLRDFIKTADEPRLKMLVDENPGYFYDVLPYAMALGLTSKWTHLFETIDMEAPSWFIRYRDDDDPLRDTYTTAFASSITSSIDDMTTEISRAVAEASYDPSSSYSSSDSGGSYSGGGSSYSGGGSGGGGMGSW